MTGTEFFITPLEDNERVSKFVVHKNEFKKSTYRVLPTAFSPSRKTNALSAYRTKNLSDSKIWYIAQEFVTKTRSDNAEVRGRADLSARIFKDMGLHLNPDGTPHPRHLNVENWPLDKPKLLDIRTKLANKATLVLKPD